MAYKTNCEACGVNLLGPEILEEKRCDDTCADNWDDRTPECLQAHCYGKGSTHFLRSICVEIPVLYDGGLYNKCPDCGHTWHRWPEGYRQRAVAQPFIDDEQEALDLHYPRS